LRSPAFSVFMDLGTLDGSPEVKWPISGLHEPAYHWSSAFINNFIQSSSDLFCNPGSSWWDNFFLNLLGQ
jgi:hypothetical protein